MVLPDGRAAGAERTLDALLELRALTKRFNRQCALDAVDLSLRRGEVHGMVGENGSGKSTLIKILAGVHAPSEGSLYRVGRHVPFPTRPGDARRYGLAFVHQDLGLVPELSVADNLALAELARVGGSRTCSRRGLERRAREKLCRLDVDIDPARPVGTLAAVDRAKVAIVRALDSIGQPEPGSATALEASHDVRVLVLDEPTVFLPRREIDRFFAIVRAVAASGAAVLFVSHDLDEVRELCGTVTVLRDGRVAGRRPTTGTTVGELVELMVGRSVEHTRIAKSCRAREVDAVAVVTGLRGAVVDGVDMRVAPGEILGVTGLGGSGFEELPYLLYGAIVARAGEMVIGGTRLDLRRARPRVALRLGVILVPGDRRRHGIVGSLTVADNITLPRLESLSRGGILARRRMLAETRSLMERFDVRPRDALLPHGVLSGGNQQKGVLAKWLSTAPTLVLLDEPTQGVDIGAREQIFAALRQAAARGAGIVCASSDYAQLAVLCDRVLVLHDGVVVDELDGDGLTKADIAEACLGAPIAGHPRATTAAAR